MKRKSKILERSMIASLIAWLGKWCVLSTQSSWTGEARKGSTADTKVCGRGFYADWQRHWPHIEIPEFIGTHCNIKRRDCVAWRWASQVNEFMHKMEKAYRIGWAEYINLKVGHDTGTEDPRFSE